MGASYVVPAFSGSCINCGYALARLREISATYFETGTVQCVHCRLAQDIWPSTPVWLAASLGFPGVLATLAFLQVVDLELQVGQIIEISFAGYLPTGAALLS